MTAYDIHSFNDHLAFINEHLLYYAGLSQVLIIAGNNDHIIAFPDIVLLFKSCFHFILYLFIEIIFLLPASVILFASVALFRLCGILSIHYSPFTTALPAPAK